MNLLPFVIVIITILALFSTAHFERHIMGKREHQIYTAYFQGLRGARSHKEKIAYNSLIRKEKSEKKNVSTESKSKDSDVEYFRYEKVGWKHGRLYLSSLKQDAQKWPQLKKIAAAYVNQLYGDLEFFPKDGKFAEKLLTALTQFYKNDQSDTPFHEVKLGDKFQDIFHKMAKGTQTYELGKNGIPPFGNFFSFDDREDPPMFFQEANITFLTLVLGQKETDLLVEKEKEEVKKSGQHRSSYGRAELVELLNPTPPGREILDLFEYRKGPSVRNPGKHTDPLTRITVRAP